MNTKRWRMIAIATACAALLGCEAREAPRGSATQPRAPESHVHARSTDKRNPAVAPPPREASPASSDAAALPASPNASQVGAAAARDARTSTTAEPSAGGPVVAVATQPVESSSPPAAAPPRVPDYMTILARFDEREPFELSASARRPSVLEIRSRNVQRIRLARAELPLEKSRSVMIRIDGYGIEWTPRRSVVELERSQNGAWRVADERP